MLWSIGHIAKKRAQITPNKPALIYEGTAISYKQLNDQTNRVANLLNERDLVKGDRISAYLLNCPEFLAIYFAAAKLGLIFVPINFRLTSREIAYQLNDCRAKALFFHDQFRDQIDPLRGHVAVEADKYFCLKLNADDASPCPDWACDFSRDQKQASVAEPAPSSPVELADPLAIIYTSGVTGDPKGAVLSHEQTYYKNFQVILYMDLCEDDVLLSQLPLFHSGGLFIVATPALCRGATLLMRQTFEPVQFAKDIEEHHATVVLALTTMWRFVQLSGVLDEIDVSSVRRVLGGGERTPQSLLTYLSDRGLHMQTGFGQTENSFMALMPKGSMLSKPGAIGLAGFFTDVWIEDASSGEAQPNAIGEIRARGPTVMSGYWNLPEKTAETLVEDVLRTGDLGCQDEDGFLYIIDRAKDMYRSGGENVYPAEVEKILADHPKVAHVAIVGVPDEKWGESGKAFVVAIDAEAPPTERELLAFLDGKVARYKFPAHIELLPELPLTATGKVRKVELKKTYLAT